jgi:micrococcal nuclease
MLGGCAWLPAVRQAESPAGSRTHDSPALDGSPLRATPAVITRVVDGDSVWLRTASRERVKSRIVGIDAPEVCQAHGAESTMALAALLDSGPVAVEWLGQDIYRRALVRLWVDGTDIGQTMVANGQAWSYAWRQASGPYDAQEATARSVGAGLFANARAVRPSRFRQTHGPCR